MEVERGDREDLVAVDERAAFVDRDDAVGVAVEREAGVGARDEHRLLEVGRGGSSRSRR